MVNLQFPNRPLGEVVRNLPSACQNGQRCQRDKSGIHLKEIAECLPIIAPTKSIGSQEDKRPGEPSGNRIRERLHIIGSRNKHTRCICGTLCHVRHPGWGGRVKHVPTLYSVFITVEFFITRDAPNICGNVVFFFKESLGF